MDTKIWMVSLIIMFAVRPICAQDAIFKMSSVSPGWLIIYSIFYMDVITYPCSNPDAGWANLHWYQQEKYTSAYCPMAPSHYLNQYGLITHKTTRKIFFNEILFVSPEVLIKKMYLKVLVVKCGPLFQSLSKLTHWGWVTHICVGNLTIIGSENGLSPGRRQVSIWTNAGILLIGPSGTAFSKI